MAVQLTGMRFVNYGLNQTVAGITQYNTAVNRMAQTVTTATQHINRAYTTTVGQVTNNIQNIGTVVNNFSRSTSAAHGHIIRFGEGLKKLIITMTGFYILKRIINSVLDAFTDLFRKMVEGASNTQLLTIRFQNLVAISQQATGNFASYADALAASVDPAKDLLEWVNLLAVKTRFGRDEIGQILSLGMAFDLTAGQAKTLTTATIDWASGMGLEEDALQRMVVNFGQMMRMGKITQRELRDLAIGGLFPVNEALRRIGERAGYTGDALAKFMQNTATSGVPVNALLTEFIAISEERFPKAGERMAKTWAGVSQNIKDFVTTIAGAAILGPTMDKVVNSLSDTLDKALSPSVRAAAYEIGERLAVNLDKLADAGGKAIGILKDLAKAFGIPIPSIEEILAGVDILVEKISSGMDDAVDAVENWLSNTGQTFAAGAQEFLKWGFELIAQFGIGMMKGITTVLTVVMDVLAGFLSLMLQPFSPPRIAPKIDQWGKKTMETYLKGMTNADYSILYNSGEDIQHALEKSIPKSAKERSREREDSSAILGITTSDILNATANIGQTMTNTMIPAMEFWGETAMNAYLKGMTKADFDILKDLQSPIKSALDVMAQLGLIAQESIGATFAEVTKQIIIAMRQLEKTGKVGKAVFESIRRAGGELGDELAELARRQFALLAVMKQLEKAQRELNEAQTADTAAKGRVDDLIKEYRDLVEAGANKDVLNAKRAEIKAAMDERQQTRLAVTEAEKKVETAEDMLAPLREQVELQEALVQQMIALAQAQVQASKGAGAGLDIDLSAFEGLGDAIKETAEDMDWLKVKMAIDQVAFENRINAMVMRMNVKLKELFAPITEKWDEEVRPSIDKLVESFNNLSGPLTKIVDIFKDSELITKIAEWAGVFVGLRLAVGGLLTLIGLKGAGIAAGAAGGPVGWLGLALAGLATTIIVNKDTFAEQLDSIFQYWDNLKESVKKRGLGDTIDIIWDTLFGPPDPKQEAMETEVNRRRQKALDDIKNFFKELKYLPNKVNTWFKGAGNSVETWLDENISQPVDNFVADLKEKWETFKTGVGQFFEAQIWGWKNLIDPEGKVKEFFDDPLLALGITGESGKLARIKIPGLSDLPTLIEGWLKDAKQKVVDFFTGPDGLNLSMPTWLSNIFSTISDWFTGPNGIITNVTTWLGGIWTEVSNWFTTLLSDAGIYQFVEDFKTAGADLISGLIKGVQSMIEPFINAILDPINAVLEAIGMEPIRLNWQQPETDLSDLEDWDIGGPHAKGGLVTRKGLYPLAENGPEMVIPAGITSNFLRAVSMMNNAMIGAGKQVYAGRTVSAQPIYNSHSNALTRNYNLSVNSAKSSKGIIRDFSIMETLAG